jgi:cytokinin riboside 5'-monophosphate phosphoribohydrolase
VEEIMARLICVYCSSSDEIDAKYCREAERFGRQLVEHGWGLVYGGGNRGVMGVVGRTVKATGGLVVGVIPEFMKTRELALDSASELITVATMRERKQRMEERAEGFVTLPGGIGTLEEFSEVLALRHLNRLHKPIVLVNQDGFYDDLLRFFERLTREHFKSAGLRDLFAVVDSVDQVWRHLEQPKPFIADELWREGGSDG